MSFIRGLAAVVGLGALGYYAVKKGCEQWQIRRGPIAGGKEPAVWPIFPSQSNNTEKPPETQPSGPAEEIQPEGC